MDGLRVQSFLGDYVLVRIYLRDLSKIGCLGHRGRLSYGICASDLLIRRYRMYHSKKRGVSVDRAMTYTLQQNRITLRNSEREVLEIFA
jgi:hypothetical protein